MDLTEKLTQSVPVYNGKLLQVYRDIVSLSNGKEEIREVMRHPGAAVIAPHLGNGQFVLVRQYRHAIGRETLEFPAGRLDLAENPLDCARRELEEETGYCAGSWRELLRLHPAPGYTDELLHLFLAADLSPGANHPDEDEQLLVVEVSFEQLLKDLQCGLITDAKTVAALLHLKTFGL